MQFFFRRSVLCCAILFYALMPSKTKAQTTLAQGDVSIIGFCSNSPQSFCFVTWVDLQPNTVIRFSDNGFIGSGLSTAASNYRNSEQTCIWTTASGIAAGTVINIVGITASVGSASITNPNGATTATVSLSNSQGDQIFAYQSPNFFANSATSTFMDGIILFGLDYPGTTNTKTGWLTTGTTSSPTSYKPSDLQAVNQIVFSGGVTGGQYTGSRSGMNVTALRAAIAQTSNWTTINVSGTAVSYLTTNFDVATTWNGSVWSNGAPDAATNAVIGSSTAPASFICKKLTINNGIALNTTGITITVNGDITNNGNGFTGTGTLNIAANSTLSGNALTVNGTVSLSAGMLTTNGLLVISPTGKITGSYANLSGDVTLQQSLIGQRGWRILSNPFTGALNLPNLASTNGITINTTVQASGLTDVRTFSNSSNTWSNVTANTVAANTPYSLFVRGLSTEVSGTAYSAGPSAFTFKATGNLNGNSVGITPTSTSNFLVVGNPYAAPVKTSALTNGTGVSYYVYTITQGGSQTQQRTKAGSWAAVLSSSATTSVPTFGAVAYKPSSTGTYNIASAADILTTGTVLTNLFRQQETMSYVEMQVEQEGQFMDKFFVRLDANATPEGTDRNDLEKFYNDNLNLYTKSVDHKYLAIDARPHMDSIPVGISALAGDYVFKVATNSLPSGYTIYLVDRFLNTKTELRENIGYPFSITADAASKGENRFVLNFSKAAPIAFAQAFEVKVLGNIVKGNSAAISIAGSNGLVSITITDMLGRSVSKVNNLVNGIGHINMGNLLPGMYLLQASDGKTITVEKVVKQ